jgi:hypothetical protein
MNKWHSKHVPPIIHPTVPTLQNQTACNMTRRNGNGMGTGRNMKEDNKEWMCVARPFKSKLSISHIFSRTTHGNAHWHCHLTTPDLWTTISLDVLHIIRTHHHLTLADASPHPPEPHQHLNRWHVTCHWHPPPSPNTSHNMLSPPTTTPTSPKTRHNMSLSPTSKVSKQDFILFSLTYCTTNANMSHHHHHHFFARTTTSPH